MYEDFKDSHADSTVKEAFYRLIFCTEYNLSFHCPKKDQCKFCEVNKENPEKRKEYEEHLERKNRAQQEKAADSERAVKDDSYVTCSYDLQSVLYTPCSNVSCLYHTRKLAVYNFTIFVHNSKCGIPSSGMNLKAGEGPVKLEPVYSNS